MRFCVIEKTNELLPVMKSSLERIEKKIKEASKLCGTNEEENTAMFLMEIMSELNSCDATCRGIMTGVVRRALEPLTKTK